MWKIAVGFIVFAALAMYVISKGGDSLDMGGEKHGAEATHVPDHGASAAASAPMAAASTAAPVASEAASAASK